MVSLLNSIVSVTLEMSPCTRVKSADFMLLGGSLRYGKVKTQLCTPLADGYIVPIQQLARLTGKPGLDIMTTIQEIIGAGGKGRSEKILEQLGIKGRAFGGPVKAGIPVVVGEPLPGQKANPEVFLPYPVFNLIRKSRYINPSIYNTTLIRFKKG